MSIQWSPDGGSTSAVCYPTGSAVGDVLIWLAARKYSGRHKMRARRRANMLYSSYWWTQTKSGAWVPLTRNRRGA